MGKVNNVTTPLLDASSSGASFDILKMLEAKGVLQKKRGFFSKVMQWTTGFLSFGVRPLVKYRLIPEGFLGLSLHNGRALFHGPGRYAPLSVTHNFKSGDGYKVAMSEKVITHGNLTILRVDQRERGVKLDQNGKATIIEPGTYILQSPQERYAGIVNLYDLKETKGDTKYEKLGPVEFIYVEPGHTGVAQKGDKLVAFEPGSHVIHDPDIRFVRSVHSQPRSYEMPKMTINLRDSAISMDIVPNVTLRVKDAKKYVNAFPDLEPEKAIENWTQSHLTNIFSHLTLNRIAPSVPATFKSKEKLEEPDESFTDYVNAQFLKVLQKQAEQAGIELIQVSIESRTFAPHISDMLKKQTEQRLQAETNLRTVDSKVAAELKSAEGQRQKMTIEAQAQADKIAIIAKAEAERAKSIEGSDTAKLIAILEAQAEVAAACGNKTTFLDANLVGLTNVLTNPNGVGLFKFSSARREDTVSTNQETLGAN